MAYLSSYQKWNSMSYSKALVIGVTAFSLSWTVNQSVQSQEVDADGRPVDRVEFQSYQDVEALLERLAYTPAAWQAGIREVPRLYLTDIPPRWREQTSREISVLVKKQLFFRMLAPLALRANELILRDRGRAESLANDIDAGRPVANDDRQWLNSLAVHYRLIENANDSLSAEALTELLMRVERVPLSLALSQAAEESGWGTSRFAAEGNALFGQWTWGSQRIAPLEQRAGLGDYGIAAFETPLLSIIAYMRNLNTHAAYADLRTRRAEMRAAGERISGWLLAETLTSYSERGSEYVDTLHTIMRVNQLDAADDAYLSDDPSIYLIPVSSVGE